MYVVFISSLEVLEWEEAVAAEAAASDLDYLRSKMVGSLDEDEDALEDRCMSAALGVFLDYRNGD